MSKKDKNLVNPETVIEETETKANAEVAADGKEGKKVKEKKKKKQTYTVEELLAHSDEIVYEDEFHRKVKIKVKTNESKLRKREARKGRDYLDIRACLWEWWNGTRYARCVME